MNKIKFIFIKYINKDDLLYLLDIDDDRYLNPIRLHSISIQETYF